MSFELKVIGAGLGRTGTTSLHEALSRLLGGPCFHMLAYKAQPELMAPWSALARDIPLRDAVRSRTRIPASQWERLMPGCVACVDEPAAYYWRQLAEEFPKALVILSLRDVDSWWASVLHTFDEFERELRDPAGMSDERRAFHAFTQDIYPDWRDGPVESLEKAMFEEHNRRVLEHAASDAGFRGRLLVWRVEQGWGPICEALGVEVPSIPFPHRNKRLEYHGY